ncbi:hypothetical protein TNCV_3743451 [Trichonephila clavipes]|nr:hypothetical protein TNCV_3743451 [Trichonephila clavipes]
MTRDLNKMTGLRDSSFFPTDTGRVDNVEMKYPRYTAHFLALSCSDFDSKPLDLWTLSSSENDESINGGKAEEIIDTHLQQIVYIYTRHFMRAHVIQSIASHSEHPSHPQVGKRFLGRTNLEFSNFLRSGRHLIEQLILGMTPTGHLLKLHFADDVGGGGGAVYCFSPLSINR